MRVQVTPTLKGFRTLVTLERQFSAMSFHVRLKITFVLQFGRAHFTAVHLVCRVAARLVHLDTQGKLSSKDRVAPVYDNLTGRWFSLDDVGQWLTDTVQVGSGVGIIGHTATAV